MNDDKFHAKILQVKSYVDEFGKLFEQEILVESIRGETFWIFDVGLLCNKQMEGQMAILEFNVWQHVDTKNVFKLQRSERKIVLPEPNSTFKDPEYYPIFYGEIIKKIYDPNYNEHFLYLDVGSGIIHIYVCKQEYNDLKIGDFIKVLGNIIHLEEVNGRRM